MLGPDGADRFDRSGDYEPPASRSQIDDFQIEDARSVLDGDVSPAQSQAIAKKSRAASRAGEFYVVTEHGGHRYGTGWGKSEFDPGWGAADVVDFVRAIVDNPTGIASTTLGFKLHGTHRGTPGIVVINRAGGSRWFVATAYPARIPS